jgi:hypothetical protein
LKRFLIALAGAGLLSAVIASSAGAGDFIYAPRDCTKPKVEPKSITLTCGDAGVVLKHLGWDEWNLPKVTGEGQLWVKDCDPSCAAGSFDKFDVKVRLLNPQPYTCGGQSIQMYRRVHIRFKDQAPPHQNRLRSFQVVCV